jgi:aspartyl aminopeptidase
MTATQQTQQLLDFIDASPSPWHVVNSIKTRLAAFQFIELNETAKWTLHAGGRYYVVRDDSSIIAFVVGQQPLVSTGFKLIGTHTDSPGLRIKPNAATAIDGLLRLAVEVYGGPILATFADRDLSLAGRISYKDEQGKLASRLVQCAKPLLRLPNLAIHMNRMVNEEGLKLHKQQELPLILTHLTEQQLPTAYFSAWLQQQAEIEAERILSWDLAVYDTQKGVFWGANNEFYANSQLDNLASCHAALTALLDNDVLQADSTLVCAFFDHEEIGSESHKGADGSFLADTLERIALATQTDAENYLRALAKSFMISADMAHAYQPSFPLAYDSDHKVMVNQGPVIKVNANQRYSTTSGSDALFALCCESAGVPYQKYSHRNDLACGSTIGPMASSRLGIHCVDVGNPLWAMHSIRESAGVWDHHYMIKAISQFFTQ